jgi:hypothetical protein
MGPHHGTPPWGPAMTGSCHVQVRLASGRGLSLKRSNLSIVDEKRGEPADWHTSASMSALCAGKLRAPLDAHEYVILPRTLPPIRTPILARTLLQRTLSRHVACTS